MPSQSAIYLTFRGSTSIEDWINNARVDLEQYPYCANCSVHKGFFEAEKSVNDTIQILLQKSILRYPEAQALIITGHSLGGAMATLTAMEILLSNLHTTIPLRLFNFGSPRVGNPNFAIFASATIPDRNRVTHYRDIVPHLPSRDEYMHISGTL
jgi:predicted lipase